jgi:SlyX protein
MSDERLTNLEARFAWLERHGLEQDKATAELGDDLRKLRREIASLRERLRGGEGPAAPADEPEPPPPHY